MAKSRDIIVVLSTVGSDDEADRVARALVEEGLAACVNRVAVASTYRWQGALEEDDEVLLVIKSAADLCRQLEARINELSSYEVAEFVVIEAAAVSSAYREWLSAACRGRD